MGSTVFLLDVEIQFCSLARWCGQATGPCPQRPTPPCTQFGTLAQGFPWRGPCNPSIDMPTVSVPMGSTVFLLDVEILKFSLARCGQATVPCPQRPTPPCTQFGTLAQGCPWRGPCNPSIDMPSGFFPWAAQFLLDAEVQHFSSAPWCGQATAPCPQRPTGLSTTAHPPAASASADITSRRRAAPHGRKSKQIFSAMRDIG